MEQEAKSTRKRQKAVAQPKAVIKAAPLTDLDREALRAFVYYSIGDGHLSSWEENFLNTIKRLLQQPVVFVTKKQEAIISQIKEKLHYNKPDEPLPPIDPDGIVENTDPDGYSIDPDVYPIERANDEQDDTDLSFLA